jgi:hypothetical protein
LAESFKSLKQTQNIYLKNEKIICLIHLNRFECSLKIQKETKNTLYSAHTSYIIRFEHLLKKTKTSSHCKLFYIYSMNLLIIHQVSPISISLLTTTVFKKQANPYFSIIYLWKLKYKKKFKIRNWKMNSKLIISVLLMLSLSVEVRRAQLLGLNICFEDKNCASGNCVMFQCKPQACRSDQDCANWGHTSHFCAFISFLLSFFLLQGHLDLF